MASAYEIIAMGDAEMLRQAFEGVALMTGGDDFTVMIKIGLVVGLLFGAFKAALTTKLDLMPMIVGFFAYMIMFAPKVTVNIVDPFGDLPMIYCDAPGSCGSGSGGVLTVAHVPIGIAMPMSMISSFSISLSDKASQVFGTPNMYQNGEGYLNGVQILARMRNFNGSSANANNDPSGNTNVRQSFVRFWRDCVQYSLDSNNKTYEAIVKSSDLPGALTVNNAARDTILYLGGTASQMSCSTASTTLLPMLQPGSSFSTLLKGALKTGEANTTFDALTAAISDTTKIASLDAERAMLNAYIRNMMSCAQSNLSDSDCITMTQATEQRNTQWAQEQSVFKQIARPLMAFVEMFMVAATPLMAFLVASGFGLQLASKYFGMIAWIALWPFTMTLCNIYIYNAAGRAFVAKIPDGPDPSSLLSVRGLESLFTTASDWVATGSMLASSVPALTMMLVYGSSAALSGIAGRLQSSGHVDEKLTSPDIAKSAPFMQDQSRFTNNKSLGGLNTGMEGGLDRFQIGASVQAAGSNARSFARDSSSVMQSNYGDDISAGVQKMHSDTNMKSFMTSAEKSMTSSQVKATQTAKESLRSAGFSESDTDSLMQKGGVQASLGISAFGSGAGVHLGVDSMKGKTATEQKAMTEAWRTASSTIDSTASAYKTARTTQAGQTITDTLANGMSEAKRAGFQKTLGQQERAQEMVQESEQMVNTLGASGDKDVRGWAAAIRGAGQGKAVIDAAGAAGLNGQAAKNAGIYKAMGMDSDLAQIAGAGMALQTAGLAGNHGALNAVNGFHAQVSGVSSGAHAPTQKLSDTGYDGQMAAGAATANQVAAKVANVPGMIASADNLMGDGPVGSAPAAGAGPSNAGSPKGASGRTGKSRAPAHGASSPKMASATAPAGEPSGASNTDQPPSLESLVTPEQRAFSSKAKAGLTPSGEDMKAIVDKVPAMKDAVIDGAAHGASNMADYAKENPAKAAGIALGAATLFVGGPVAGSAFKVATGALGKKLATKMLPGLFKGATKAAETATAAVPAATKLAPIVNPAASASLEATRIAQQATATQAARSLLNR